MHILLRVQKKRRRNVSVNLPGRSGLNGGVATEELLNVRLVDEGRVQKTELSSGYTELVHRLAHVRQRLILLLWPLCLLPSLPPAPALLMTCLPCFFFLDRHTCCCALIFSVSFSLAHSHTNALTRTHTNTESPGSSEDCRPD